MLGALGILLPEILEKYAGIEFGVSPEGAIVWKYACIHPESKCQCLCSLAA